MREIEPCLAQKTRNCIFLQAGGVEEHADDVFLFVKLSALDAIDFTHTIECAQLFFSGLRLIVECDLKVRHFFSLPKHVSQFTL